MNLLQLSKEKTIKHCIIWTIVIIYLSIVASYEGKVEAIVVGIFIRIFGYIFTYYFLSLFLLKKYGAKPIKLAIRLLLYYILFCSLQLAVHYIIMPSLGGQSTFTQKPVWKSLLNITITFFIDTLAAYAFYNHNLSIERLKSQSEKERFIILKELIFLRNQFHSNFTFDFINYCYNRVRQSSDMAAQAIKLFSKLIEYSLSVKQNEKVDLQREVAFIEDYITLQKLLNTHLFIQWNCEGLTREEHITSRILITFIENALKHGVTNDTLYPILINLKAEKDTIYFSVENKKSINNKSRNTGIGQQNAKQYLEIFYPKKYNLHIQDSLEFYRCHLSIYLKN